MTKTKNEAPQKLGPRGPSRGPGMGRGHAIGRPVEKAKDFKGTFKRLLGYLFQHRLSITIVFLAAILSTAFTIVSPKVLGDATTILFDGFVAKKNNLPGAGIDFLAIKRIIGVLIALYFFSALFTYLQQYIMVGVAQKTVYNLRDDINEKLKRLPLSYYDKHSHGDILSRAVNDVDNISSTLQQSLTQLITALITIVGIVGMMLFMSPLLTLIILLSLPLSLLVTVGVAKRSQLYFIGQQNALGELNGHVEEMLTGHTVVKAYGQEKQSIEKFIDINENLYDSGWRAQFVSGIIMPLMNFIGNLSYVLICLVGGISVAKGNLQIGHVQAFIQYARQFTQPITRVANIANIIQSTIASAERVFEILDAEEEDEDSDGNISKLAEIGEVSFNNVNFSYDGSKQIIKDFNLRVEKGTTVAIVGATGAGKTTLVNLLMRFYDLDSGEISISGENITNLKRSYLRSLFGMVLQDTWLFNGTIKDNIAYGCEEVTDKEIVKAAKAAHADHFIRTLPDGYNTLLNEDASNISQGQKQLLTIARAILAKPAMLILDEATSNVDTRTELSIQTALDTLLEGRTSFVIAHRLSTIMKADVIIVMDQGKIVEKGNHDQLLAEDGLYADLFNSQFNE